MNQKIFVLGDSRTGTTSLHKLFMDYGYNSVHYFMDEVNRIARQNGREKHSYQDVKEFIEESGFEAFSDYPTRTYYSQLRINYPDAHFILSTRSSLAKWESSMKRYFPNREDIVGNLEHLSRAHLSLNAGIRDQFHNSKNFLEICIDDNNIKNSELIASFLGKSKIVIMGQLNAAKQ